MEGRVTVHHDVPADILKDLEDRYHLLDKQRWNGGGWIRNKNRRKGQEKWNRQRREKGEEREKEQIEIDTEKSHCVESVSYGQFPTHTPGD